MPLPPTSSTAQKTLAEIIMDVASDGYSIVDDFLPPSLVAELCQEAQNLLKSGAMRLAGTGKGGKALLDGNLRGDLIHWLGDTDSCNPDNIPARLAYLQHMELLREEINQHFYLGLFDFECHFAIYPPGKYYRKHLDQFRPSASPSSASPQRQISCILYLNKQWHREDGGQLKIYLEGENDTPYLEIEPIGGRLVTFLSSRFWHEVLPAKRERVSLTGWFRTRA